MLPWRALRSPSSPKPARAVASCTGSEGVSLTRAMCKLVMVPCCMAVFLLGGFTPTLTLPLRERGFCAVLFEYWGVC